MAKYIGYGTQWLEIAYYGNFKLPNWKGVVLILRGLGEEEGREDSSRLQKCGKMRNSPRYKTGKTGIKLNASK